MKSAIHIVEVGPRDGLQNEKAIIPSEIKLEFIDRLVKAGLKTIETTSIVSPKWVPQMADHETIIQRLPQIPNVRFPILVPNKKGLDKAMALGVKHIAVFAAASETFSQKNINRSIKDSLAEYHDVIKTALAQGIQVRGYVSCVLGCPYEGEIKAKSVLEVTQVLLSAGCYEISLGDTIGVGTPSKARNLVKTLSAEIAVEKLALHFHDTYGQALSNIFACLDLGIQTIDSAVAGLGGCPYAKGATGNVATEEVVYMLEGMGIHTGIDLDLLIQAGEFLCRYLKQPNHSKVAVAILAKRS
jgi:hydroxymethylglutaryl-CoA lyase